MARCLPPPADRSELRCRFVGNVYRPGDPLLSISSGDPYVLIYLPRRYLFSIYVGMQMRVTDGQHTENGVVSEILPVTASLPKEFQNTFQPSDRNQLAKVRAGERIAFSAQAKGHRLTALFINRPTSAVRQAQAPRQHAHHVEGEIRRVAEQKKKLLLAHRHQPDVGRRYARWRCAAHCRPAPSRRKCRAPARFREAGCRAGSTCPLWMTYNSVAASPWLKMTSPARNSRAVAPAPARMPKSIGVSAISFPSA